MAECSDKGDGHFIFPFAASSLVVQYRNRGYSEIIQLSTQLQF